LVSLKDKLKTFLQGRQTAYVQVFNPESKAVQAVLRDLAKFCRASESTFHADPRAHALIEGRREVWLRILEHTNLNPEEFWKKYGREDLP
jgi:hypothetical protein